MVPRIRYFCLTLLIVAGGVLVYHQQARHPEGAEVAFPSGQEQEIEETAIDLTRKPLARIPVGTVVGEKPPPGWSNLVLIAIPTLVPEDEAAAPRIAAHYARMFKFTVLANVAPKKTPRKARFCLQQVARGFAMTIEGQEKIISGQNTLGGDLGIFGKLILKENEKILDNDVLQVARTPTMLIFDAKAVMRRGTDHEGMLMRHALVVDPSTGRLFTLVWLLTRDYALAEEAMQLLPEGLWEKRFLSVKSENFIAGLPTREAFALRQVPQGTAVPYTPTLQSVATVKTFDQDSAPRIEETLRAAAVAAAGK